MCGKSLTFWYCAFFLLIALSAKLQQNFTDNEEKNDNLAVRYEIDAHSTTNYGDEMKTLLYDSYKKSTNNTQYEDMQYESRTTSTSSEDDDSIQFKLGTHSIQNHEDDKQIPMESCTNSTNANHKSSFTSHEIYGNLMSIEDKNDSTSHEFSENSSKDSIDRILKDIISSIYIPYEMYFNPTGIPLCCPLGDRLLDDECLSEGSKYTLPYVYGYTNDSLQSENKTVDELFPLVVYDPCRNKNRFWSSDNNVDYIFFANGSLYLSYYEIFAKSTSYCLAVKEDKYDMTYCSEMYHKILNSSIYRYNCLIEKKYVESFIIGISFKIVSISLLISIFLVYSILPELRNVHGFMLCNYSGVCIIAYIFDIVRILNAMYAVHYSVYVHYSVCITIAFFLNFSFLASFFWLIIMSFDMWWTFRGFCSLQRNVRQQYKRKLVFYTIFAWGLSLTFAIITVIMDSVSENLPEILRPKFNKGGYCWFSDPKSNMLYFHGPRSICIISSICLSISTALKIARYGKEIDNCLTDSERKRYNDSKKWFNLYLKLFILLFIIMGIDLSLITVDNFFIEYRSYYIHYSITLTRTLQNLCFFIIFVWKKHILQMLLKRFGCGLFPENSCATNATSSSTLTCIITLEKMPIQKKMSSCEQKNEKDSSGETKL